MRKILLCLLLCTIIGSFKSQAQILKRLKQTVKEHVENRAEERTGEATDKMLDKTEKGVKGDKEGKTASDNSTADKNNTQPQTASSSQPSTKTYKNYDFVPGDSVIFESNLTDERVGEIPSQFILSEGQIDVQPEDGENVIHEPEGADPLFTPRMKNNNYLPDQFTVEFDYKNEKSDANHIDIRFGEGDGIIPEINFWGDGDGMGWTTNAHFPDALTKAIEANPHQWHHFAIAINKNVGKVYIDQFRVLNVNNLTGKADKVSFYTHGYENSFIKNIRIAAGGIDAYKKVTTDGRIIMHGILFDVDKATLKPQSMGSINEIYYLLKKDPSLKFEIDGHTDNTGDAAHNLTLSQERAESVKAELVKLGIDGSRLTTKGFGDTKPISDNDTPEGKANNRRVEFVKK